MKSTVFLFFLGLALTASPQDLHQQSTLSVVTGLINYEGDLKPNSFTFRRSNPFVAVSFKLPLHRWVTWRSGILIGSIEGTDKENRTYLQSRNLTFNTGIKEINTGFEFPLLNLDRNRFSPYLFAGVALFRFNPWAYDESNRKIYLKPLGTEGQGLTDYPDRLPYKLTQAALLWGAGSKYLVTEQFRIGIEFSQRKTFTDYLDDVSLTYVDRQKLFETRGQKAVDMAYRGDELPNGLPYPKDGEQRGTPTEKDWYYYLGINAEINMHALSNALRKFFHSKNDWYYKKCPTRF